MNYVGNFSKYVPSKLIKTLLNRKEEKHYFTEDDRKESDAVVWTAAGYNLDKISYYSFDDDRYKDLIKLPKFFGKVLEIWFTKLDPGDMFPAHQDVYSYKENPSNIHRYCMMLQDYKIGHVFVCEGKHLEDYKLGDTYEFNHEFAWHGACNIGLTPRLTMQIVCEKN